MQLKKIVLALSIALTVFASAAYAGSGEGKNVGKGIYSYSHVAKKAVALKDYVAVKLAQEYLTAQKISGTITDAYVVTTKESHKQKIIVVVDKKRVYDFSPALSDVFLAHKAPTA